MFKYKLHTMHIGVDKATGKDKTVILVKSINGKQPNEQELTRIRDFIKKEQGLGSLNGISFITID